MAQKSLTSKEPAKVPIIEEVLEPSTGHYIVQVRMPIGLVADFPNEPWGTLISDIGLPRREWIDYDGYELVDIKRLGGDTEDLYWIFEKLPGPLWSTIKRGVTSLIPSKFRRFITLSESRGTVDPATLPDAPTGDLIMSQVGQEDNTGRAEKTNLSQTYTTADPLEGQLTDTWGVNTTQESISTEGDAVTSGFGVKQATQRPTGDGLSVHTVENYPADSDEDGIIASLYEEEHDEATGAVISIGKHLVDASQASTIAAALRGSGYGSLAGGNYVETRAQDKWHSITIAARITGAPTTQTWNETAGISLPNKLTEIAVVWNSDINTSGSSNGVDSISAIIDEELTWRCSAQGQASGYVEGRPVAKVTAGISGNADVQVTRTFHSSPPAVSVSAHQFKPVYGYVTIQGDQLNVVQSSFKSGFADINTASGGGTKYRNDSKIVLQRIGPVEHELGVNPTPVDYGDSKSESQTVTVTSGSTPSAGIIPTVSFTATVTGSVSVELPSSSTPLLSGATYVSRVVVRPWRFGYWVKEVYTVTVP